MSGKTYTYRYEAGPGCSLIGCALLLFFLATFIVGAVKVIAWVWS